MVLVQEGPTCHGESRPVSRSDGAVLQSAQELQLPEDHALRARAQHRTPLQRETHRHGSAQPRWLQPEKSPLCEDPAQPKSRINSIKKQPHGAGCCLLLCLGLSWAPQLLWPQLPGHLSYGISVLPVQHWPRC